MDRAKPKRPWETDHAKKESVANILGALSFGRLSSSSTTNNNSTSNVHIKKNEDSTSSSTHEEDFSSHAVVQEDVVSGTARGGSSDMGVEMSLSEEEEGTFIEKKISEIEEEEDDDDHHHRGTAATGGFLKNCSKSYDDEDDSDVNSVPDLPPQQQQQQQEQEFGQDGAAVRNARDRAATYSSYTKSPVREIVRDYEEFTRATSSGAVSCTISPVLEEMKELIPDGLVAAKIHVVEWTSQRLAHQRVMRDCAAAAQRRNEARRANRPISVLTACAQQVTETEMNDHVDDHLPLVQQHPDGRGGDDGVTRSSRDLLSLPHFAPPPPPDTDDDDIKSTTEDNKSVVTLDDDSPVLSVTADHEDDEEEEEYVEEKVIVDETAKETPIAKHVFAPAEEDSNSSDHRVEEEEEEEQQLQQREQSAPELDLEELRRQRMRAEMERGMQRAAAAAQMHKQKNLVDKNNNNNREGEQDVDGFTIDTAASTTKTPMITPTTPKHPLLLGESGSLNNNDFPLIPSSLDQLSESDVLSSTLSSTNNDADSLQYQSHGNALLSPRKRMADIIRSDLWDKDDTVVESALKLLVDKLTHSTDVITFRNAIARNGGILAIVRAMEQHVEHAGIQIVSCRALEQLALDTENELAIGEVGGVEAILGAMMTHFTHVAVQEAAWSALCNCTCGNACDTMTIDTQGGMLAIVSCMKQHLDQASIQSSAVGTLTNLCWNNESRLAALVHAGGFAVLAMTLQKHWNNVTVRNETAHAMHVLLGGAALAHQEQQGEPDVIDELLVLRECDDEHDDDDEEQDEEVEEEEGVDEEDEYYTDEELAE